jgi:hypothetical protein
MRGHDGDRRRKRLQIEDRRVAIAKRRSIYRFQGLRAIYLVRIKPVRIESHSVCLKRILSQLIHSPFIRASASVPFLLQGAPLELERRLWRTLPARARG